MTRGHGLIMRGAAAARLNMMLHGLGPYVPERERLRALLMRLFYPAKSKQPDAAKRGSPHAW
jgi:hypothetical protein